MKQEKITEQKTPQVKLAVNLWEKMKEKNRKRWLLVFGLLFLLALFVSFSVPVYYVPLFNNISAKYGLPSDVSRKLTLLDLSLSSLGIETQNMTEAFKKQKIVDDINPFYTAYYEPPAGRRLINAKETYYHEFERTRRRPAEVAGVYKDGKSAETPEIGDTVKGVRALPDSSSLTNADIEGEGLASGNTDFSSKNSTVRTNSKDEISGSSKRQVRGAYDNDGSGRPKHEYLPDFASTIYDAANGQEEPLTLNNSRMVQPVVNGAPFTVSKSEDTISKLIDGSSFVDNLVLSSNFGNAGGSLGYYVTDDLPKDKFFNVFGLSGKDALISYFYSYAAIGRKYLESSKHFAEIAFHGDNPQDQVLLAKGQTEKQAPKVDLGIPPLVLMITVKNNLAECNAARRVYEQTIPSLIHDYEEAKNTIIGISSDTANVAWRGAPGSCGECSLCTPTRELRESWNNNVEIAREKCKEIRSAGEVYANACKMEYLYDGEDSCEEIDALLLDGGEPWLEFEDFLGSEEVCRLHRKWRYSNLARNFSGCGNDTGIHWYDLIADNPSQVSQAEKDIQQKARRDCIDKIGDFFKVVDNNVELKGMDGFMFN